MTAEVLVPKLRERSPAGNAGFVNIAAACAHRYLARSVLTFLCESESVSRRRQALADQMGRNTTVCPMLDVKHPYGEETPWPVFQKAFNRGPDDGKRNLAPGDLRFRE